jgi:hypothetical protein
MGRSSVLTIEPKLLGLREKGGEKGGRRKGEREKKEKGKKGEGKKGKKKKEGEGEKKGRKRGERGYNVLFMFTATPFVFKGKI